MNHSLERTPPTLDQLTQMYACSCVFCKSEFFSGYRGLWCQEACWRLSKVLTRDMVLNRIVPDRERLEKIYGADTPEFAY